MPISGIKNAKYCLFFLLTVGISNCDFLIKNSSDQSSGELGFDSSNKELTAAFDWAKNKALSYAHDGSDSVGYWYEAALPQREAFCMRDVSHQTIGAEVLGLGQHNYNMILKFAQNISPEKDYCSYWEINRFDKAAPVDYENDKDFWYNLPANFDVIYSAYRLYKWTGNRDYLENPDLIHFYDLSLNEYIDHWDLSSTEIQNRNRSMYVSGDPAKSRFGKNRGIPTYNEGGRGETFLGIDMTASIIAAYKAYSAMLALRGEQTLSAGYRNQAQREQAFLDAFWWDADKQAYRSILYEDGTFDYFMVGEDQAFLHYLYYFEAISDDKKFMNIVNQYEANFDKLIVELKSYLPIIFYENGRSEMANNMIIDLCSIENKRRDYPENSFTVIEHLTRGLMGIEVDAATNMISTISRVEKEEDWAEMKNIPLLANKVTVKHFGKSKTTVTNRSGGSIKWEARIPGTYAFLYLNGDKVNCRTEVIRSYPHSSLIVELNAGEEATVSIRP